MSRGWIVTLLAGIAALAGDFATAPLFPGPPPIAAVGFHAAVGAAWIVAGLVAWARRPSLRIGILISAVGFAWLLSEAWWPAPLPVTVSFVLRGLPFAVALHALIAFPTGRIGHAPARALVIAGYATVLLGNPLVLFFSPPASGPDAHWERNLLLIDRSPNLDAVLNTGISVTVVALGVLAAVLFVRRWRRTSTAGRAVLGPVIWSGVLAAIAIATRFVVDGLTASPQQLSTVVYYASALAFALIPLAFLLGLVRGRLRRGALTRLMVELGGLPAPDLVRDALARALGDPSMDLVFWQPDSGGYIGTDGLPAALPSHDPSRMFTELEHGGERFGALIHDPFMLEDGVMLDAVGAAGRLAIDNARLQAELRAQLSRVRASRSRIVEADNAARRQIERDLHDGAQQRLLAIGLALRLARGRVGRDDAQVLALLGEADGELTAGLDELRSLARGIHPAVLTDEGLPAALAALARRSPVPVELRTLLGERLPAPLEAAAYFVASEALVNVAKYAKASCVTLTVARADGRLRVEVIDDGIGGADASAGSGLSGLTDRVEALDGQLHLSSVRGAGTTLLADFPCPDPAATPQTS